MWIIVPEGKSIKSTSGGYVFIGPQKINKSQKFKFSPTYTDGTPVIESESENVLDEIKNPEFGGDSQVLSDPQDGFEGTWSDPQERGGDSLREHSGENVESKVLLGELSKNAGSGGGGGKSKKNNTVSKPTPTTNPDG